jgi:hypothetical protein
VGPITLFDKSFLQALSLNEAVWFDHFFNAVVCPLFYLETLADLAKTPRAGRTGEQEVASIARKAPEKHGTPCIFHSELWLGNLLGFPVPMNSQVPIRGGRRVKSEGKIGDVVGVAPEIEAFQRWVRGEFFESEAAQARVWRQSLQAADLRVVSSGLRTVGIHADGCKELVDVLTRTREFTSDFAIRTDPLQMSLEFAGVSASSHNDVMRRHRQLGSPRLGAFSPYAAFALELEVFSHLAIGASLVSGDRHSNKVDLGYLFYLPFCHMFVSSDKLHRRCAPLFLREDQQFVWGPDLKAGLAELDEHFGSLPLSERERGLDAFATWPPEEDRFLVTKLFDEHVPRWREVSHDGLDLTPEQQRDLVARIKAMTESKDEVPTRDTDTSDFLSIERSVQKRKGDWYQLPKNFGSEE